MPEKTNILQSISLRDLNHIPCVFVVYPVCEQSHRRTKSTSNTNFH